MSAKNIVLTKEVSVLVALEEHMRMYYNLYITSSLQSIAPENNYNIFF